MRLHVMSSEPHPHVMSSEPVSVVRNAFPEVLAQILPGRSAGFTQEQ
jgi:hypothetical protein